MYGFYKKLNYIPYNIGNETRIDRALRLAQKEMFTTKNGARPGVPKILILFVDGAQTKVPDTEDPSVIAKELRKEGIELLAIGLGSKTDMSELIEIVGSPRRAYPNSFSGLSSNKFGDEMVEASCSAGKNECNN